MINNFRILTDQDKLILALAEKAVQSKHQAALADAEFAKLAKDWPPAKRRRLARRMQRMVLGLEADSFIQSIKRSQYENN